MDRDLFTTLGELAGAGVVVAGVAMIYLPAAVIVAGVALIVVSALVGRR